MPSVNCGFKERNQKFNEGGEVLEKRDERKPLQITMDCCYLSCVISKRQTPFNDVNGNDRLYFM